MFLKKYLSNLVTGFFLAIFIWYAYKNQNLIVGLASVGVAAILLVALGKLIMHLIQGLFTKWTAEVFTKKFTFGESIYIGVLSAIGNFFGPLLGGAGVRATYLKKVHNLPYNKFGSTMLGYYLILFSVNCIIALLSLKALGGGSQVNFLVLIFSVWLLILFVLMIVRLPKKSRLEKYRTKKLPRLMIDTIYGIESGWRRIFRDKKLLLKLVSLAVLSYLAVVFLTYIEFGAIGVNLSFASMSLYSVFITVSLLFSVTPGAIGIRESMLIIFATTLGITNQEILQVALIDRGVNFALLFVLFAVIRTKRVKKFLTASEQVI